MKKIVVYGLGNMGQGIAKHLMQCQAELDICIVALMDKRILNEEMNCEVLSPDNLRELQYDYILITSERWYEEISEELKYKHGVRKEKIIHLKDLALNGKYYCNLCNTYVPFMLDTGIESPIFFRKNIVGGGKRNNCICPVCGGGDRERWVKYVLMDKLHIYSEKAKVLHFAPERQIEHVLRRYDSLEYITADIEEGRADRVEDITNISYADNYFDYIICNHVLEHIEEEKRAFAELYRCVKPSGKIFFSVPICWEIDTFEDDSIVTGGDRLKEYGQEDHVRLYGKDLQNRLEENGFDVVYYKVSENLSQEEIEKMRLIPSDIVWILSPRK